MDHANISARTDNISVISPSGIGIFNLLPFDTRCFFESPLRLGDGVDAAVDVAVVAAGVLLTAGEVPLVLAEFGWNLKKGYKKIKIIAFL